MIDHGSVAGLNERKYELHVYCLHCNHWRVLDLEGMVRRSQGSRRSPIQVRCCECEEVLGHFRFARPSRPRVPPAGMLPASGASPTQTERAHEDDVHAREHSHDERDTATAALGHIAGSSSM